MKFRKDFVTNSSSSSYICEICGEVASGWDMGLSEAEMMKCKNGHVFCCSESLPKPNKETMVKMILENHWNEYGWDSKNKEYREFTETELCSIGKEELFDNFCSDGGHYDVPECVCPICQFIEYSESDLAEFLFKEYGVDRNEVFKEVKKTNKRRRKLYDCEYITYVCNKFNISTISITESWKDRFKTYQEFKKYIKT